MGYITTSHNGVCWDIDVLKDQYNPLSVIDHLEAYTDQELMEFIDLLLESGHELPDYGEE